MRQGKTPPRHTAPAYRMKQVFGDNPEANKDERVSGSEAAILLRQLANTLETGERAESIDVSFTFVDKHLVWRVEFTTEPLTVGT